MKYIALYRKYRPQTFKEVIGQNQITKTLINVIKNQKVGHAYLFCGPRGTGKTSTAKILAKTINCLQINDGDACNNCINCNNFQNNKIMDLIEIDGASNNGVDEIRELRDKANLMPGQVKYKIYIIDEVHMLTNNAFNALLKILEEPPRHIIFILATTEAHKIPVTVISRCQKYDFRPVVKKDIINNLENILKKENIKYDQSSLEQIAILSEGGVRDSLSILEQVIAYSDNNITLEKINNLFLIPSIEEKILFLQNLFTGNIKIVLSTIDKYFSSGIDINRLTNDLILILKDIIIYKITDNEQLLKILSENTIPKINLENEKIIEIIHIYLEALNNYKFNNNSKMYFELCNLKIINLINNNLFEKNLNNIETKVNEVPLTIENSQKSANEIIKNDELQIDNNYSNNIQINEKINTDKNNIKVNEVPLTIENSQKSANEIIKNDELQKINTDKNNIEINETSLVNDQKLITNENNLNSSDFDLNVIQPLNWQINDYINVIIQADGDIRQKLNNLWNDLEKYLTNNKYKSFSKILLDTTIVAAMENAFILSCQTQQQADIINTYSTQILFQEFLFNLLKQKETLILAISRDNLVNIKKEYFQLRTVNKLNSPFKMEFNDYKINENLLIKSNSQLDKTLQQAQEIFGNINIVD